MNCVNHSDREGVNSCSYCGDRLCSQCSIDIDGRTICKRCISRLSTAIPPSAQRPVPPLPPRPTAPPPAPMYRGGPRPNRFFLFVLSMIPGANYMYLGLMKRGLFVMSTFFLCTYLASFGIYGFPAFGLVIPVLVITSFFDGFNLRRKMIEGEDVPDDISGILSFISNNKLLIGGVVVLLLGMNVLSDLSQFFRHGYTRGLPFSPMTIVLILVILFVVSKRKSKEKNDKPIDMKNSNDNNRE